MSGWAQPQSSGSGEPVKKVGSPMTFTDYNRATSSSQPVASGSTNRPPPPMWGGVSVPPKPSSPRVARGGWTELPTAAQPKSVAAPQWGPTTSATANAPKLVQQPRGGWEAAPASQTANVPTATPIWGGTTAAEFRAARSRVEEQRRPVKDIKPTITVVLNDIASKPHLNGARAIVVKPAESSNTRWIVKVKNQRTGESDDINVSSSKMFSADPPKSVPSKFQQDPDAWKSQGVGRPYKEPEIDPDAWKSLGVGRPHKEPETDPNAWKSQGIGRPYEEPETDPNAWKRKGIGRPFVEPEPSGESVGDLMRQHAETAKRNRELTAAGKRAKGAKGSSKGMDEPERGAKTREPTSTWEKRHASAAAESVTKENVDSDDEAETKSSAAGDDELRSVDEEFTHAYHRRLKIVPRSERKKRDDELYRKVVTVPRFHLETGEDFDKDQLRELRKLKRKFMKIKLGKRRECMAWKWIDGAPVTLMMPDSVIEHYPDLKEYNYKPEGGRCLGVPPKISKKLQVVVTFDGVQQYLVAEKYLRRSFRRGQQVYIMSCRNMIEVGIGGQWRQVDVYAKRLKFFLKGQEFFVDLDNYDPEDDKLGRLYEPENEFERAMDLIPVRLKYHASALFLCPRSSLCPRWPDNISDKRFKDAKRGNNLDHDVDINAQFDENGGFDRKILDPRTQLPVRDREIDHLYPNSWHRQLNYGVGCYYDEFWLVRGFNNYTYVRGISRMAKPFERNDDSYLSGFSRYTGACERNQEKKPVNPPKDHPVVVVPFFRPDGIKTNAVFMLDRQFCINFLRNVHDLSPYDDIRDEFLNNVVERLKVRWQRDGSIKIWNRVIRKLKARERKWVEAQKRRYGYLMDDDGADNLYEGYEGYRSHETVIFGKHKCWQRPMLMMPKPEETDDN